MKSFKFLKTQKTLEKRAELDKIKHRKSKAWTKPFLLFSEQESRIFFAQNWLCTGSWQTSSTLIEPIKYFPHTGSLYFCSWLQKIWFWMVYILALKFLFEFPFTSMFVVAFLQKTKIGAKFKFISRNHSSTISCKNCNWQLQSDFAIYSCSYSSYQLKKIATKSCLQLKIAIHDFLQLLVELRLLSGCKNLQCIIWE